MSNATHNDVLQFLESLDNLQSQTVNETNKTNAPATSTATTTESVLQFLDEITNTTTTTTTGNSGPSTSTTKKAEPTVTTTSATATATASVEQKQEEKKGWNWGTFWNSAQNTVNQASQNLKKGVEAAQRNIEGNERLRGIASQFNKENIEKLGNDLKKMTVNVIDSIAPPIGGFNPDNETTLWLQINDNKDFVEQANDVVKYVVEEMFDNSSVKKNVIKGKFNIKNEILPKEKQQQSISVGINDVMKTADNAFNEFITAHPKREPKVQQVTVDNPENSNPSGTTTTTTTTEIVTSYYDMFLYIQPFSIDLTRPNTEKTVNHIAYYILYYYPNYEDPKKDIFINYITQSVSCKDNMETKQEIEEENNPLRSQIYEEWNDDRKLKVIEGGVWTVFEELLIRMKDYRYDAEAVAGLSGQII
ncbi:hypothetical protein LY90DRAFT_663231 [Neocallimastix californiae]|jgi:ABC-type antimicrobial peptide transport system permease subunit|uniref:Maintenance of telomere capping protein 1 n=1 Tax=Neocallimastix californiae TaxID=1754190 RepID=A0A1Y2FTS1_9FUNG|nr:hypothetical protein LY90DRAFT_663231 [Neocallimastix californiae]|eukprot:ORY86586.1 hypothetical protein LY90DRAFT_663231 [Neocallimastix californiae]